VTLKKPTQTPAKPSPRTTRTGRPTTLDDAVLVKIVAGCTNENLTTVVIK
jgi:hypothetical protein